MDNKELIKEAYKNIVPSEELIERTLAQNGKNAAKRFPARRGAAIAIAAAAACALTVSAAALGGLLDFNALFGSHIEAGDEKLAGSFIRSAENVVCAVSDDDYTVELKAAAGDANCVIIAAELRRADGTPVKEHFECLSDDEWFQSGEWSTVIDGERQGGYCSLTLNGDGNIDIYSEAASLSDMNGKRVTIEYGDIFASSGYTRQGLTPVGTRLLDLQWTISFDYDNSGASAVKKCCYSPEKTFAYHQSLWEPPPEKPKDQTVMISEPDKVYDFDSEARIVSAEFGMIGGSLSFKYQPDEETARLINEEHYSASDAGNNEFYLICADGTRIKAKMQNYFHSHSRGGDEADAAYNLIYGEDLMKKSIVDIDSVTALEINGTVFELS